MASTLTQTMPFILLATNMENQWPGLSGGFIVMVGDVDFFLILVTTTLMKYQCDQ